MNAVRSLSCERRGEAGVRGIADESVPLLPGFTASAPSTPFGAAVEAQCPRA